MKSDRLRGAQVRLSVVSCIDIHVMIPRVIAVAVAISVLGVFAVSLPASAAKSEQVSLALVDAIEALPLAQESRTGYERTAFRHWIDADKDGCSTRAEVLLAESKTEPVIEGTCRIVSGSWHSYYDNQTRELPGGLDIDHMVPLAEAWDSGASQWTLERRRDYANDLGDPRALVAVTAASNRSKSDQDPATWLPTNLDATCQYLTEWVAVKTRWSLSVDAVERQTLKRHSPQCTNATVTVEKV